MRTSKAWLTLFSMLAALIALPACEAEEEPAEEVPAAEQPAVEEPAADLPQLPPDAPADVTPEMVAEGQELFTGAGNCYTCHAQDASGTQLAPDLTDDEWINIDGEYESVVEVINTGVPQPIEHPSPMPPMGGAQLNDEQVRALAAYVYALGQGG